MRFRNPYKDENEMMEAFGAHARAEGWLVFPETSGFDMLLVATDRVHALGVQPGDQVGVEGKRACNMRVLVQAMPKNTGAGPHYHLVVVPRLDPDFAELARTVGIMAVAAANRDWGRSRGLWVKSDFRFDLKIFPTFYRQYYEEPCWHPEVEIWVPSGVASPKTISPWKVKAVRLCMVARRQGFLTSDDFRQHSISMGVWRTRRWLIPTGEKKGRLTKYVLNELKYPYDPPPHLKYPEILEALSAAEDKYDAEQDGFLKDLPRSMRRRKRAA
jgi:hypothetical protein